MAIKLPKANTAFDQFSDTDLAAQCQNIADGLTTTAVTFPAPPIAIIDYQAYIDAYTAALVLATGPGAGRQNTAAKDATKLDLINATRAECAYVNQVIALQARDGVLYPALQTLILSTGFILSKQPTPAGPLPAVEIRKNGSFVKGQYYILAIKIPNAKGYAVRVLDTVTNELKEIVFPGTRMTITGLVSGRFYTFAIAAIGANPTRDFATAIIDVVVI